jgi:twitching motility protein PilT
MDLPAHLVKETGQGTCAIKCPAQLTADSSLNEILLFARRQQASDIHISAGSPVFLRRFGSMSPATTSPLSGERVAALLKYAIPPEKWGVAEGKGDVEFVHVIPGAGRFRIAIARQRFGWDLTARVIDMDVRGFKESGMPPSCAKLTQWAQGLILIAGAAGCGKTSTLATLVDMVNQNRDDHIITIENPVEVVFTPKRCQISQREVGFHTASFVSALRAGLREDPDIIVVSELRDLETVQIAVTAAETGHLVFGTMNTNDAAQTVMSLVNSFSNDEQPVIRNMVSETLRGVICQQLVPRTDGAGVVPAYEILIMNSAASALIKSGKMRQLNNVIATGKTDGMAAMDNSLYALAEQGLITLAEANRRSTFAEMTAK